jgi:hypothetical protein
MRSFLSSVGGFAVCQFLRPNFAEGLDARRSCLVWKDNNESVVDWWNQERFSEKDEKVIMTQPKKESSLSLHRAAEFYYLGWIHLYTCNLLLENSNDVGRVESFFQNDTNGWCPPFALELKYSREIPKSKILENAMFEMCVVVGKDTFPKDWQRELGNLNIPDVDGNTVLRAELSTEGHLTLFSGATRLGASTNVAFSKAFLAIWLSEKSRNNKLAKELLVKD